MTTHSASPLEIVKIAEDSYHFMLRGKYRQIDETVNGSQLLAMLGRESLDSNGTPVEPDEILEVLDSLPVTKGIELSVMERVA
jgi:hypothetical protein